MKLRTIQSLFLVVIFSSLGAQTLTNRQVYDFDPGDLIIKKYMYDGGSTVPQYYTKDSIISKYYSIGLDTLYYEIFRASLTPQYTPHGSSTYSSDTIIDYYTDLDSIAIHINLGNYCSLAPLDTFYTHNCLNRDNWNLSTSVFLDTTCFEPNYFNSTLIEGVGGPFYSYAYGSDPNRGTYTNELIYARKGSLTCGSYYDFPTTIDELKNEKIHIFPNPTKDILTISLNEIYNKISVKINDISGKEVLSKKFRNIKDVNLNINNLVKGIYFVQLQYDEHYLNKKIIKQ